MKLTTIVNKLSKLGYTPEATEGEYVLKLGDRTLAFYFYEGHSLVDFIRVKHAPGEFANYFQTIKGALEALFNKKIWVHDPPYVFPGDDDFCLCVNRVYKNTLSYSLEITKGIYEYQPAISLPVTKEAESIAKEVLDGNTPSGVLVDYLLDTNETFRKYWEK